MRHVEPVSSGSATPAEGWWEAEVRAGDEVPAAIPCSVSFSDLYGDVVDEVVAPEAGVVLFVTTSPAVTVDGILLGLGAGLSALS